ncbi:hypothetical protein [Pontibacter chitinilyticus]|uniref:hypothetical protein n=1 Tax=Pontibacter chitinilyticus TaxID=2674989 RepID=UPI003219A786
MSDQKPIRPGKSATGRALMAVACFIFAGVQLTALLESDEQINGRSLIFLILFAALGGLYLFLFWKAYKRPKV